MRVAVPQSATGRTATRLDPLMLVSLLVSGAVWLVLLATPLADGVGGWGLCLIGAAYVVVAALPMAALYARAVVTWRQEVGCLGLLWLAAVAIWTLIGAAQAPSSLVLSDVVIDVFVGLWIGTPCFIAWQVLALAVRVGWRRWSAHRA